MLAHAESSSALPCPLVSRLVSRQNRLETLVFQGKTGGFAAERTGTELSPIFPVFFTAGRKGLPPNDICRPCLKRATADLARDRN